MADITFDDVTTVDATTAADVTTVAAEPVCAHETPFISNVADSALTSSSVWGGLVASKSRLFSTSGGWAKGGGSGLNQYIQVEAAVWACMSSQRS